MTIPSFLKQQAFKGISLSWFLSITTLLIAWNLFLAYVMIDKLHMNDFGKFYYSIVAYIDGHKMYGPNPATLMEVIPGTDLQYWNLNPPHFHLFLLPLGLLSPPIALTVWAIINYIAGLMSLRLMARDFPQIQAKNYRRFIFLAVLAFSGTGILFITAQLSLLLLLPITLAWIHIQRGQWEKGGMLLGFVCSIKPFLLIFVPYLIFKRQYAALMNFFLSCGVSYLVGFMIFGKEVHLQWLERLEAINWYWAPMNGSILGFLTRTFSKNLLFTPIIEIPDLILAVWVFLGGIIGTFTCWVIYVDKTEQAVDRAFLLLLLAALLISPLGWQYYFIFCLGPLSKVVYFWWSDSSEQPLSSPEPLLMGRTILGYLSIPGFLIPLFAVKLFQPNALATILLGSVYFWGILCLWVSVILDGFLGMKETLPAASFIEKPNQLQESRN
jgi:alpha-1,2-mannosyltransferase